MILIAHRGNINGPESMLENKPEFIDAALNLNYHVEIDVWVVNHKIFLGHDQPEYEIDSNWLTDRFEKLWIHCKNVEAITFFKKSHSNFNFFWHENDVLTLTSNNYIWANPGKQPIEDSIAVLPEINNDDISKCLGICSDYISKYNFN